MSHLELTQAELCAPDPNFASSQVLGQFTATAIVGNAVLGSVFYAFPAVALVSGVL